MKNALLILMLLMLPIYLTAAPKETEEQKRMTQLENQISSLQQKIKELNQDNDCQKQLIQTSHAVISSQLTAGTWVLGIVAIVIALISIVIGAYVNRKVNESYVVLEQSKSILEKQNTIKKEVDELNTLIKGNLDGLYSRIKEEETKHLILRLKNVPEDIANLHDLLASRDLSKEYYLPLKESYLALDESQRRGRGARGGGEYHSNYILMFFQHFAGLAFLDIDIYNELESSYNTSIDNSFKNDIIKSTEDIITACVDNGLSSQKDKLNKYLKVINKSQYSEFEELYKAIFKQLISKENQFLLYGLINKEQELEKVRCFYGRIVKENYSQSENTESQKLILKEINELITKVDKEQTKA